MHNVAHAARVVPPVLAVAPPAVIFEAAPGSARHTALVRWHHARLRMDTAVAHPRFPVIAGSAGGAGEP